MNLDWTVAWQYRGLLAQGVLVTVLLTVLTMALAVPGGIAVMLLRQSRFLCTRWTCRTSWPLPTRAVSCRPSPPGSNPSSETVFCRTSSSAFFDST